MEELELITKYRESKDLNYLTTLYEPYMNLVYGTCLKYLKNTDDAQDAVMDIFEKLTKKIHTSQIKNFKGWLYTVSKNHCLEILRRAKTVGIKESSAALVYSESVYHPDSVDNEEELRILKTCMENLDVVQRDCIRLFYFEKMNYQDIALHLSIQYNQVRSRIQNGRRNLKICMESKSIKS